MTKTPEEKMIGIFKSRRLATGPDGSLTLLSMETNVSENLTRWWSMTTSGARDIRFHSGEVAHDGHEEVGLQTLSCGMAAIASDPKGGDMSVAARCVAELFEQPEAPEFVRFFSVCGAATLLAANLGRLGTDLAELDKLCGRKQIDRLLVSWPFLLAPLLAKDFSFEPGLPLDAGLNASQARVHAALAKVVSNCDSLPELAENLTKLVRSQDDLVAATIAQHCEVLAAFDPPGAEEDDAGPVRSPAAAQRKSDLTVLDPERIAILLKRMRSVPAFAAPAGQSLKEILSFASAVPPDWLPSNAGSYDAFSAVARSLSALVSDSDGTLELAVLAASSKGRWAEFHDRIKAASPHAAVSDVKDMVKAFRRQIVVPAILYSATSPFLGGAHDDVLQQFVCHTVMDESDPSLAFQESLDRVSWTLLFEGKSAPAVLEASDRWHLVSARMDSAIGTLSQFGWLTPFDRVEIEPGVALVAISNSRELAQESSIMGHCVGSYAEACLEGSCVIAAIRRRTADGDEISTSTVQLSRWTPGSKWSPLVVQHRAAANGDPCADDVHDLNEALRLIWEWGRIPLARRQGRSEAPQFDNGRRDGILTEAARRCLIAADMARTGRGLAIVERIAKLRRRLPVHDDIRLSRGDRATQAAQYNWAKTEQIDAAFSQWRPFMSRDTLAMGPARFCEHLDRIAGDGLSARLRSVVAAELAAHPRPSLPELFTTALRVVVGRFCPPLRDFLAYPPRAFDRVAKTMTVVAATLFVIHAWAQQPPRAEAAVVTQPFGEAAAPRAQPRPLLAPVSNAPSPEDAVLVERLWSLAMTSGRYCASDGRFSDVGYPCYASSDLLVVVDADRLSVYRTQNGVPIAFVFGAAGSEAEGYRVAWLAGRDWSSWIDDRLENGRNP
ncbi:hypothetical protein ACVIGB_000958 [Bradyrhizobium sp. USDA 4341]